MKGVWLEDLTSSEARGRFDRGDAVVIPVASAGSQGADLPLGAGAMIARALGQRLIERLPVVVAPIVSFGGQWIQAETFRQILCEVVDAFRAQGVTRVVLLEAGLSTERRLEGPSGGLVLRVQDVPGGLIDRLRSASAGVGDPSHATACKGERLLAAWSDALAAMLTAEWPQLDA